MNAPPLITLVIPSFNAERTISDTLDSILAQSYSKWECIIIDDGSTDSTTVIVERYVSHDQRFTFKKRTTLPKGASKCRNLGLSAAKGEYVIFLDSDDFLAPYCLEQRANLFLRNYKFDFLVFPQFLALDDGSRTKRLWNNFATNRNDLLSFLSFEIIWQTMAPIYKTVFLKSTTGFNEEYTRCQDVEFTCRLLMNRPRYKKMLTTPDNYYRVEAGKEARSGFISLRFENIRRLIKDIGILLNHDSPFSSKSEPSSGDIINSLSRLLIFNLDNSRLENGISFFEVYKNDIEDFLESHAIGFTLRVRLRALLFLLQYNPLSPVCDVRIYHFLFPKFWPQQPWGEFVYDGEISPFQSLKYSHV